MLGDEREVFRTISMLLAMSVVFCAVALGDDALLLDPDEDRIVGEPDVAVADDGSTVVVWSSRVVRGAQPLNGIRIRRFDAAGAAVGEVFRIDVLPGDLARKPSADMTPDGSRVVVAWEGGAAGRRTRRRIWAQVFDTTAKPRGVEFRVDQRRMTHEQWGLDRASYRDPKVSMAPDGSFVVVWRSEGMTSCDRFNISARRFSRDGVPLGDEFIVNTDLRWSQLNPDVDHDASGGFIVVWQSGRWIGTSEERSEIRGRSFDAAGTAKGDEFALARDTAVASFPSLVVAPNGSFACGWKVGNRDREPLRIAARVFNAAGAPIGSRIDIETEAPGVRGPYVTLTGAFEIMIAWLGHADDRFESPAVVAQTFSSGGTATSEPFPLIPATCWEVSSPAVRSSRGYGAVAWKSNLAGGIVIRRFSADRPTQDAPLVSGGRRFQELVATGRDVFGDRTEDPRRRQAALDLLTCMRQTARAAAGDLRRCLDGSLGFSESACCGALAATEDSPERGVATLLDVLMDHDRNDGVRAAAACNIGRFGEFAVSATPALLDALGEADENLRGCAGEALGQIGAVEAVDAISAALRTEASTSELPELHQNLVLGLAALAADDRARRALIDYEMACEWLTDYVDWHHGTSDLAEPDGLERYARYSARSWRVGDSVAIDHFVQEVRRCLDGGLVGECGVFPLPDRRGFANIVGVARRYLAIRSLGEMEPCDCMIVVATGLSAIDPLPDWAGYTFSEALLSAAPRTCLPEMLEVTQELGSENESVSTALAGLLGDGDELAIPVLRALTANDPGCEQCLVKLRRLLADDDPTIVTAAIRALIAAGPEAIRQSKLLLTKLLQNDSKEVREAAGQALDLIEVEAEGCDSARPPDELPALLGQTGSTD